MCFVQDRMANEYAVVSFPKEDDAVAIVPKSWLINEKFVLLARSHVEHQR